MIWNIVLLWIELDINKRNRHHHLYCHQELIFLLRLIVKEKKEVMGCSTKFEKVGDIVETCNEVGVGIMNGGSEVEVLILAVSMADDKIIETRTDEV